MPVIENIQLSTHAAIGIWRIVESREDLLSNIELSNAEKTELDAITSERSSREWLACRLLIKEMMAGNPCIIIKDAFGKPFFEGSNKHISISHTHGFAAAIISDYPSGIDIQKIDSRIETISFKFINAEEWESIPETENRLEAIHLVWGAKEALYKLYGKKNLAFKDNLHIYPFKINDNGVISGHVSKDNYFEKFKLDYQHTDEYLLVYVAGK